MAKCFILGVDGATPQMLANNKAVVVHLSKGGREILLERLQADWKADEAYKAAALGSQVTTDFINGLIAKAVGKAINGQNMDPVDAINEILNVQELIYCQKGLELNEVRETIRVLKETRAELHPK